MDKLASGAISANLNIRGYREARLSLKIFPVGYIETNI